MGKDSPSPPPAPDYAGAATAQGAANKESAVATAMLGNPNVNSPYGSQTVSYAPGPDGNWIPTVNQQLNPQSQSIFDQQQALRGGMAGLGASALSSAQNVLGRPFDPSSVPSVQGSIGNQNVQGSLDTSGIARMPVNAGMTAQNAIMSRLAPQLGRERDALQNRLVNQGLQPGTEAYGTDMQLQGQRENDLLTQAALHGIGVDMNANQQGYNQALQSGQFSNQAAGQRFGQELQQGQFANTAQQQALSQALYQRNLPLNEISALMSGSQIQNPQFQQYQGGGVAPVNYQNMAQQQGAWDQGLYNQQVGTQNANTSGLYGLGAAALMGFSDRRLKSSIERVGTHPLGIGIYEYDIFGHRERGVMADELETVMPEAVHMHPSGFKMVDYGMVNFGGRNG